MLGDPLVQSVTQSVSADSIRTAITTVFARREYDRSILPTILGRIVNWVLNGLGDLVRSLQHAGPVQKGAVLVLMVVVIAIIARLAIVSNAAGVAFRRRRHVWFRRPAGRVG